MYDSRIPEAAIPVSRETLPKSDAARGLSAMTPANVGMTNQDDSGAFSKPYINQQPSEQAQLAMNQASQNQMTAGPQAGAAARGMVIANETAKSNAQGRAQALMNERLAGIMDAQGNGGALMQLNALMQSPEREALVNTLATNEAMYREQAPELGAYRASTMQYKSA